MDFVRTVTSEIDSLHTIQFFFLTGLNRSRLPKKRNKTEGYYVNYYEVCNGIRWTPLVEIGWISLPDLVSLYELRMKKKWL